MTGGTLPVLTFHALDHRADAIAFPPDVFRRGIARLRERGYRSVGLLEVAEAVRAGRPLPAGSVVLTFDDGYRSVHDEAFPVLREHGMTATVFLTVGAPTAARLPSLGGRTMLAWEEIRAMQRAGFAFGAHTLTHPDLTRLSRERAAAEVLGSKAAIEDALGAPVRCFAYPFGRYDASSRALAREHFDCACADTLGLVRSRSDPWALERVETYYFRDDRRFELVAGRWLAAVLRLIDVPRRLRRIARRA